MTFPDDETLVFTVASEAKDGYVRFMRSANEYDIKVWQNFLIL